MDEDREIKGFVIGCAFFGIAAMALLYILWSKGWS
jgi:hypothetical protein